MKAVSAAIAAHWREAGTKYSPDHAAIAKLAETLCFSNDLALTREEAQQRRAAAERFYAADRADQIRELADAAALETRRGPTQAERGRAAVRLRLLAAQAARIAKARAAVVRRLEREGAAAANQLAYARRELDRAELIARRVAGLIPAEKEQAQRKVAEALSENYRVDLELGCVGSG